MPVMCVLKALEHYDEASGCFTEMRPAETVGFEHSLISVSMWEARWQRAFLSAETTGEERMDYVGRCMVITPTNLAPSEIFMRLLKDDAIRISDYIKSTQTATVITRLGAPKPSQVKTITSELIYYYMVELGIPDAYAGWHLNRLLTLIDLVSFKREEQANKGKGFTPTPEQNRAKAELNAARLAKYSGGSK